MPMCGVGEEEKSSDNKNGTTGNLIHELAKFQAKGKRNC